MKSKILKLFDISDTKKACLILFAAALITRTIAALLGGDRADDEGPYIYMAQDILAGHGIRLDTHPFGYARSWLPPGMGVLRAGFMAVFGSDFIPLRIFFVLLSSATNVIYFLIARRLFSDRYAFMAAMLWILYPPQWFWASRINPHTYAYHMVIICFYLLIISWEKRLLWLPFLIGILWTTIAYMRGEWVLSLTLFAGAGFLVKNNSKRAIAQGLLMFLGCALAFAPWVIRNYKLHGGFVLIATNYADNMWFAYNPAYEFTGDQISFPPDLEARLIAEPNEIKRAEIVSNEAKKFIRENPVRALTVIGGNFLQYWRPWISPKVAGPLENVLYVASYLPLFFFFVLGFRFVPWKKPEWVVIVGMLLYKMLIHIPFYIIVRFRENTVPFMIFVAVLAIMHFMDKSMKDRKLT